MKYISSLFLFLCSSMYALAQVTTPQPVEPDKETSFENYELLIVALVGLVILLAIYFYFRKNRRN